MPPQLSLAVAAPPLPLLWTNRAPLSVAAARQALPALQRQLSSFAKLGSNTQPQRCAAADCRLNELPPDGHGLPPAVPQEPHIRQASLFSRLQTMAARRRSSSMSASSDRATPRPPACKQISSP